MAGMLKLSDWEFKTIMINMLRALKDKVDSMQEQTGNVSREMEILRKNQKEILETKNTITKTKNASDGLINKLDTDEERISELEDLSIDSSKTKKEREQDWGKTKSKDCGATTTKVLHSHN